MPVRFPFALAVLDEPRRVRVRKTGIGNHSVVAPLIRRGDPGCVRRAAMFGRAPRGVFEMFDRLVEIVFEANVYLQLRGRAAPSVYPFSAADYNRPRAFTSRYASTSARVSCGAGTSTTMMPRERRIATERARSSASVIATAVR